MRAPDRQSSLLALSLSFSPLKLNIPLCLCRLVRTLRKQTQSNEAPQHFTRPNRLPKDTQYQPLLLHIQNVVKHDKNSNKSHQQKTPSHTITKNNQDPGKLFFIVLNTFIHALISSYSILLARAVAGDVALLVALVARLGTAAEATTAAAAAAAEASASTAGRPALGALAAHVAVLAALEARAVATTG